MSKAIWHNLSIHICLLSPLPKERFRYNFRYKISAIFHSIVQDVSGKEKPLYAAYTGFKAGIKGHYWMSR
jgi:hypothetical protein|tara:strand:+ start:552 stop:761 length:210 start_codon:yes stop_codon:yes gene_type:complete